VVENELSSLEMHIEGSFLRSLRIWSIGVSQKPRKIQFHWFECFQRCL